MTSSTTELAEAPALRRHMPSFIAIGVASTVAYLAIYAALRYAFPAYAANTIAMIITTVANTAANRRFTFDAHVDTSPAERLAHQVKGGVAVVLGLLLTNGGLWLLHVIDAHAAHGLELAAVMAGNAAATVARYVLMRLWVFRKS